MKVTLFFVAILFFSCEKNSSCYECLTTHVKTASVPTEGYPRTTDDLVQEYCDLSDAQIQYYEDWNKGTTSETIDNIVITDSYTTECTKK